MNVELLLAMRLLSRQEVADLKESREIVDWHDFLERLFSADVQEDSDITAKRAVVVK